MPVIASGGAGALDAPDAMRSGPAPTPSCAPRSSTTGTTRSPRSSSGWPGRDLGPARLSRPCRSGRTARTGRSETRLVRWTGALALWASLVGPGSRRSERRTRPRLPDRQPQGVSAVLLGDWTASRPRLRGLFNVSSRRARIAVRGGRDARLVAAGTTASGRPLGPAPTDAGGGGILELLAHAIELGRVLGAEPTALLGRMLTVTSTTTTHRPCMITDRPEGRFLERWWLPALVVCARERDRTGLVGLRPG